MRLFAAIAGTLSNLGLFALIALLLAVNKFSAELPDYQQLKDYHPPLVTASWRAMAVCWRSMRSRSGSTCRAAPFRSR
jgi:membrane carboxypeptidase/penicillin-binding protein